MQLFRGKGKSGLNPVILLIQRLGTALHDKLTSLEQTSSVVANGLQANVES